MSTFDSCTTYYVVPTQFPLQITDFDLRRCLGFTASGPTNEAILDDWHTEFINASLCKEKMGQYVYNTGGQIGFNINRYNLAVTALEYSWSRYNTLGGRIVPAGQSGYYQVLDDLLSMCVDGQTSGICSAAQTNICSSCSSSQIGNSSSVALINFCGCYVIPDDFSLNQNVPPECDPLCARDPVFHKIDDVGNSIRCSDAVCVINDITISSNLADQGAITFFQACPQCQDISGGGVCRCIIDASITGISTRLGIDNPISYAQVCGESSVCLSVDSVTGLSVQTPCSDLNSVQAQTYSFPIPGLFYVLAAAIVVIGSLIVFAIIYYKEKELPKIESIPDLTTKSIPNNINVASLSSTNYKQYLE